MTIALTVLGIVLIVVGVVTVLASIAGYNKGPAEHTPAAVMGSTGFVLVIIGMVVLP